ncbi:MAG: hypothetical protein M3044_14180 [Thermoproteota archaeon]|nr:hypothetical protein [Thermoproteota archaeon]
MSLFIHKHNTISLTPDSSVRSRERENLEQAIAQGSPVTPTFGSSAKSFSDFPNAKKEVGSHKRIADKIDFLICNSCFWCASCLTLDVEFAIDKCPYCEGSSIEYIPIAANETYSVEYNPASGITLEFSKS